MGGLPTTTVNGFAVHPSNPKIMWVATRQGVFRTGNAGETWTRTTNSPMNVAAVAVSPKSTNEVYAATTDGEIFRSGDSGARWAGR